MSIALDRQVVDQRGLLALQIIMHKNQSLVVLGSSWHSMQLTWEFYGVADTDDRLHYLDIILFLWIEVDIIEVRSWASHVILSGACRND